MENVELGGEHRDEHVVGRASEAEDLGAIVYDLSLRVAELRMQLEHRVHARPERSEFDDTEPLPSARPSLDLRHSCSPALTTGVHRPL